MKCAMCSKEMPYGGYGLCSDCYITVKDLESIHKIVLEWTNRGYGSLDTCIEYIKYDLEKFKEIQRDLNGQTYKDNDRER